MSRTDAHVPLPVRVARGDVRRVEIHDHTNGVCDLPDPFSPEAWRPAPHHCHWTWQYDGHGFCPCWLCHLGAENRRERRRDRQRARRQLSVLVTQWNREGEADPD